MTDEPVERVVGSTSTASEASEPSAERSDKLTESERRLLRAKVFGDVLPESTSDDRDDATSEPASEGSDEWLRRQVPPHHG